MDLNLLFSALRARFGVFAFLLMVTVAAATVLSLLLTKSYTATVSLLVDVKDEQSLGNSLRPMVMSQEKVSYLETQTDIITSERVARRVVQELKLTQRSEAIEAATATANDAQAGSASEDKLIEDLLKELKVETTQSSVVRISFASPDPRHSADVANAFAKAYIDTMLELRVEPARDAATWFDEQLKTLRAHLEEAQAKLTAFHQRQGIVSADERVDVENTRLAALSDQVGRAQEQTFQWSGREQQARESLQDGGSPDKLPEILDNPFIQRLKEDLLHGETKLQELATHYGSEYPGYQRQVAENRSLKEKLDAEMRRFVAGMASSARQSRQREAGSRQAMAAQRARVLNLKEGRNELTVLTRNVESVERAYDTAMQRFVVSQVDSRASQTNVSVLNAAVAPRKHSRPRITLNIALSVIVGTMLGIGVVMLMELFDRRIRSRKDLYMTVPLLAVVHAWHPGVSGPRRGSGGGRRALPNPG